MRPEDVKLFMNVSDLSPVLWEDLEARPPESVAAGSGALIVPGRGYRLPYMGGDYFIDLASRDIQGPADQLPPGFQKGLVLLTYLAGAQDLGLSGRMVSHRELNGGEMFFAGPHALLTAPVTEKFGRDPEAFLKKAAALGLEADPQGAGYGVKGKVLPHIAVGCVLHEEDDEFPAELTYTFDSYAHYHLALDGLWAMINVLAAQAWSKIYAEKYLSRLFSGAFFVSGLGNVF